MIIYVKCFKSNKTMPFKINDSKPFKKYKQTWKKVKTLLNIKSDSEPVYGNNKYIKTKVKKCNNSLNTNFHGKKLPKENASRKSLLLIMLNSIVKVKKRYYPETFFEESKYELKWRASGDENDDNNECDNESDNEPSNDIDKESDNE